MKKIFVLVVLVLIALGALWYRSKSTADLSSTIGPVDTVENVDKTLDGLDTADLDKELNAVDAEMQNL